MDKNQFNKHLLEISGGDYKIESKHTMVIWEYDHLGITPYAGICGSITGSLSLDKNDITASSVEVVIPIRLLTVTTKTLRDHLLSPAGKNSEPDFFGPDPADATFKSTRIEPVADAPDQAVITGALTLNGHIKDVVLKTKLYGSALLPEALGGGEQIGFEAYAEINRSEFGLGFFVPMVPDRVKLKIVAAFTK